VQDLQAQLWAEEERSAAAAARLKERTAEVGQLEQKVQEAAAAEAALAEAHTAASAQAETVQALREEVIALQDKLGTSEAACHEERQTASRLALELRSARAELNSSQDSSAGSESALAVLRAELKRAQSEQQAAASAQAECLAELQQSKAALSEATEAASASKAAAMAQQEKVEAQLVEAQSRLAAAVSVHSELQASLDGQQAQQEALMAGLHRMASSLGCPAPGITDAGQLLGAVEAELQSIADKVAQAAEAPTASLTSTAAAPGEAAPAAPPLEPQVSAGSSSSTGGPRTLLQGVVKRLTKVHAAAQRRILVLTKELKEAASVGEQARGDIATLHRQLRTQRSDMDATAVLKAKLASAVASDAAARRELKLVRDDMRHYLETSESSKRALGAAQRKNMELEASLADAMRETRLKCEDLSTAHAIVQVLKDQVAVGGGSGGTDAAELLALQREKDSLVVQLQNEREQSSAQEVELQQAMGHVHALQVTVAQLEDTATTTEASGGMQHTMYALQEQLHKEVLAAIGTHRLDHGAVRMVMGVAQCTAAVAVAGLVASNGNVDDAVSNQLAAE
jgi:chromosome segregation ATPase